MNYADGPFVQQSPHYHRYREMSVEDMLLENRVIFLTGPIAEHNASLVIMRMLYLHSLRKDQDINLYINSPGGYVDQTLAVYDTMQYLACDVATYCIGTAASGAAIALAAGTPGKRYMLPHSKVMIHQPFGGIGGQAADIHIQAEEILRDKRVLCEILAKHSGKPAEQIEQDSERDRYMTPAEAVDYGLVDQVLEGSPDKPEKKKS